MASIHDKENRWGFIVTLRDIYWSTYYVLQTVLDKNEGTRHDFLPIRVYILISDKDIISKKKKKKKYVYLVIPGG